MAVTNNLLIYAANTTNKLSDSEYESNSQRVSGVQANQVISSALHNTVTQSTTLILRALVSALNVALDDGTSLSQVWSTNITETNARNYFYALFHNMKVARALKANADGDGANIAQTYAVDIDAAIANDIITIQLLAKTASGTPSTRKIGSPIQIETVKQAKKIFTATSNINADFVIPFINTTQGSDYVDVLLGGTLVPTFNPATGEFKATKFTGSFVGNVSGSSTSCSGNATTATTASKLSGLNAEWETLEWQSNWTTNGWTWQQDDVYEMRIATGSTANEQTIGIFTITTSPSSTTQSFMSPFFSLNTTIGGHAFNGMYCLKFSRVSGTPTITLMRLDFSTPEYPSLVEASAGNNWWLYIRKVQNN